MAEPIDSRMAPALPTAASEAWTYLSDEQRGHLDGLLAALAALDGHGLGWTAHDRVRSLLACDECGHQPGEHGPDAACTYLRYVGPGPLDPCSCAEWEPLWRTGQKTD